MSVIYNTNRIEVERFEETKTTMLRVYDHQGDEKPKVVVFTDEELDEFVAALTDARKKGSENKEILSLFKEYDTNNITVADFGIISEGGALITNITNYGGKLALWSGDPSYDKDAAVIVMDEEEATRIYNEIVRLS